MIEDKYTSDVLVLGAGMAGIAAAKTLTELGVKNILVLEGSNRFIKIFKLDLGFYVVI
jgi:cation diffusion facilitator CzcD-associated flavoprotein CzcO